MRLLRTILPLALALLCACPTGAQSLSKSRDRKALLEAYPEADTALIDAYQQDSVCGTWELLCKIVCPDTYRSIIEIGYPAIGNYKAKWADNISSHMSPDRNKSPSFLLFANALTAAIKNPAPVKSIHRRSF